MRKNQKANQQRRKELNKYKGPVHRTKKKIDSLNHSIKINIHFICLFAFLFFLFSLTSLTSYHTEWWKRSEIVYESHYYVPRTSGGRGFNFGGYYMIVDDKNREWRIPWNDDFDHHMFEEDVQKGDTLQISWHYWFVGRVVESLESNTHSYRSYSDAVRIAHDGIYVELIFTIIATIFLLISINAFMRNISERKRLKVDLNMYESKLNDEIQKINSSE
ncbi:MAG: hypothetical protein PUC41_05770 [Oscillospiraceae bacterium]|nr:hypothetical protein [Oscillospiraceae bacterium]